MAWPALRRTVLLGVLVGLIALTTAASATVVPGKKLRFEISSQPLTSALREFSRQSGQQLLYSSLIIEGRSAHPLFGYYTIEEGLEQLLGDTDLEFVMDGADSVAIRRTRYAVKPDVARLAPPDIAENAQPEFADTAIAEVIVQARRRDESLQQVPVAVTALDSEDIEVRLIDNTEDLNARVPGLSVNGGNFFGRSTGALRIRGIPGVAVYVDGIVRNASAGLLMNVVEMQSVEVMRGPQGTTFGKNAVGGAIQYITQRPRETGGARFKLGLGTEGRADVTANLDVPLHRNLLSKVTLASLNRDGYVRSPVADEALGDQHDKIARAELLWRPSERIDALLIGEFAEQRSNATPATVWSLNPVCPNDVPPDNFVGGIPNSLCIYEAVGVPIDPAWVHGARKEWRTEAAVGLRNTNRSVGGTAQIDWRWSDRLVGKLLGGYREIEAFRNHDFDGTPHAMYQSFSGAAIDETNVEMQVLYSDAQFSGVTGIYYYADETWSDRQNWVANELRFEPYLSLRNALGGGYASYSPAVIHTLNRNQSEGWALFSEWTYRLGDHWLASIGARFNHDTISLGTYIPADELAEQCCEPSRSLQPAGSALSSRSGSATFTEIAPRFSLQYHWNAGVMSYYTYSQGFGAGGFTGGNVPDLPNGGFGSFGPETLGNHEIGIRTDLLQRRLRLNAAAFFGRYDDVQLAEELEETPGFPLMTNAGEGEIYGLEIEGLWTPTKDFTVNFAMTYLHAAYTEIGQAKNLRLNSPFAYAPEYTYALGVQYEHEFGRGGALSARIDYVWQDDVYSLPDFNTRTLQPAYDVANARVSYRDDSGRWEVALLGTNLLDRFYRLSGFFLPADQIETGTPARPREWALTLRYATN
jgi:iron complex outermembrane recepter protein